MRRVISLIAAFAVSGAVSFALMGTARAASVEPTVLPDNPTCADAGFTDVTDIKVDPPQNGTFSSDDLSVTISNLTDTTFDFTAADGTLVLGVLVKGGDQANLYDYRPDGTTSDTDLTTPDNASGGAADISHMDFCVVAAETPTPPPTTEPSTTPPPPPSGGVTTGGGSTAGFQAMGLLVFGGALLAIALGAFAVRRRAIRRAP
jgi:hypothetical protein